MLMALDPQIRTLIRSRTHTRRRFACHRHPHEPVTGFCALCLRDRLANLESSTGQLELECGNVAASSSGRTRGRGHCGASSSGAVPELRRSKSVASGKCGVLNGLSVDRRRKSCDVRASNTLSDLFDIDDTKSRGDGLVRVGSKNLGFSRIAEPVLETNEDDDCDGIRVSDDLLVRDEVDDGGEIEEEQDLKTMKEYIDIELQNRKRNFWEAASIFSQKLRRWKQKQKDKRRSGSCNGEADNNRLRLGQFKDTQFEVADYGRGRRSCDTEPRFAVDANRMSMEDPRFSYDEHRASWDGYMIARTIPRLTPMLPIVDNMMLPPLNKGVAADSQQMHPILEDGASSAGSAQSNLDSSSSNTVSSSSSMKSSSSKTAGLEGDDTKSFSKGRVSKTDAVIAQETKLVITEGELKNWHLSSVKDSNVGSASNKPISTHITANESDGHKKAMSSRWRKVCNLWGYKYKLGDKKDGDFIPESGSFVNLNNGVDGVERGNSSATLVRNSCSVNSRNRTESHPSGEEGAKKTRDEFVLDRNKSTRYSLSDLDSGLPRLYLSPFRKSRRSKF